MPVGVYTARKKDGTVYYRSSVTYKNKHISLGSFDSADDANKAYLEACDILSSPLKYRVNSELHTTSYSPELKIPFEKFIILINFRDSGIYIKTPIYLCQNCFLYFIGERTALIFNTDDLFYYSNHKIMARGGYYFVNDFGMQTSILSRYGIRAHSVKGRDYIFRNGDTCDYRYENILVVNRYRGVEKTEIKGHIKYRASIHIKGIYRLGLYDSEVQAAIAYNKAVDMLSEFSSVKYEKNFIEDISSIQYASIYNKIKLSGNFRKYAKIIKAKNLPHKS